MRPQLLAVLLLAPVALGGSSDPLAWALRKWRCTSAPEPIRDPVIEIAEGVFAQPPPQFRPPARKFSVTIERVGGRMKWSVKPLHGEASYGHARLLEVTPWTMRVEHTDDYGSPTAATTSPCVRIRSDAAESGLVLFSLCRLKIAALFYAERDGSTNRYGIMTDDENLVADICNPATGRR